MRRAVRFEATAGSFKVPLPILPVRYRLISLSCVFANDSLGDVWPRLDVFDGTGVGVGRYGGTVPIPTAQTVFVTWADGMFPGAFDTAMTIPIPADLWIEVGWACALTHASGAGIAGFSSCNVVVASKDEKPRTNRPVGRPTLESLAAEGATSYAAASELASRSP